MKNCELSKNYNSMKE